MLCLGLSTAHAAQPSNVRIDFVHPERFSDFSIQGRQEITSAPIFRDNISAYLSPYVARRFPGATLTLRFTDIDLAGRLEPWRIRKFNDVRFDRNMGANRRCVFTSITLWPILKAEFSPAGQKPWWMGTISNGIFIIPTAKGGLLCSMRRRHFSGGSTTWRLPVQLSLESELRRKALVGERCF